MSSAQEKSSNSTNPRTARRGVGVDQPAILKGIDEEDLEMSAPEISSIGTILRGEVVEAISIEDFAQALLSSESIQQKMLKYAEELRAANNVMSKEIFERKKLELALEDALLQEERIHFLAYHDASTGLANRALFNNRFEHGLAQAERHDWSLAVLFLDLDKFKLINDAHGHEVGDKILQIVATRLLACVRNEDTVCRHGGDEFTCLLLDVKAEGNVASIAATIVDSISEPIEFDFASLVVRPSIGIAMYPEDGTTVEELIRSADFAMYKAKNKVEGYAFFDVLDD